jgi:hypothetical protein
LLDHLLEVSIWQYAMISVEKLPKLVQDSGYHARPDIGRLHGLASRGSSAPSSFDVVLPVQAAQQVGAQPQRQR